MFYVYKLIVGGDPYFGFTSRSPTVRLEEHIKTAMGGKWKSRSKLYPLLNEFEGDYDSFEVIGEHRHELPALLQEIMEIKTAGKENTLNLSDGGEGSTVTIKIKEFQNGSLQYKVVPRKKVQKKTVKSPTRRRYRR